MNRLQYETSPYLLQHANNPVDWYPWGEEALQNAQELDRPIFLSIGYSACHWCHVMEHESFANPDTAEFMNDNFINIKVDREERPDIDDIYMQATLMFTGGHGGWPMSVFLTPDGRPFHAGTYYPPTPRHGMPSFMQILQAVLDAYHKRRDQLESAANQIKDALQQIGGVGSGIGAIDEQLLHTAIQRLTAQPDRMFGGLHGGQPKFPSPMNLEAILRYVSTYQNSEMLETVLFTLRQMAHGGMYDQIGGGFHRYSVDPKWLVPHFEKMLYDNAQLARVYLHAYQITGDEFFATITCDILTYIEREMTDYDNAGYRFFSSQDADSEGVEGKFFVWSRDEMIDILQATLNEPQIKLVLDYYGITASGNFEGHNIPNIETALADVAAENDFELNKAAAIIQQARKLLFNAREERIKPGRDEKVLTAWNGMMLASFAEAARVLDDDHYREIAEGNAQFLLNTMRVEDSDRLYRTYKAEVNGGQAKLNAYLEDYACVLDGLLELYQTSFDAQYFTHAQNIADYVIEHFRNPSGGFFDTSDDHEALITRPRAVQDNATPAGNNLMAYNLLRLAGYTGQPHYEDIALEILGGIREAIQQYPSAFGMALWGIHLAVQRPVEVAIIGQRDDEAMSAMLAEIQKPYRPTTLVALSEENQGETASPMLLAQRTQRNDALTVYVCRNFVCTAPVNSVEAVAKALIR